MTIAAYILAIGSWWFAVTALKTGDRSAAGAGYLVAICASVLAGVVAKFVS